MGKKGLIGRIVTGAAVSAAAAALLAAPAFAASPNGTTVTQTENVHGVFFDPEATNPCNGDTFDGDEGAQFTGNLVNHVTFFTNSDEVWATFTETGKVVATDDGTGVTYTGHATVWGNLNMNERNQNTAFTLTINLSGSDGSSITVHETTVLVYNSNGVVTANFDKLSLTCG
jgi:hypothetical protein